MEVEEEGGAAEVEWVGEKKVREVEEEDGVPPGRWGEVWMEADTGDDTSESSGEELMEPNEEPDSECAW